MTGIRLALLAATISGISIFVNAQAVSAFPNATLFTTLKNVIVGAALVALVLVLRRPDVRRLAARQWAGLAALGVVGGSIPFVLFFEGLAWSVNAPDASFIHKTLFVWVALGALAFLPRERIGTGQVAALGVLLAAQLVLGAPRAVSAGLGELMVLAATLLWAAEVVIARRLLSSTSSAIASAGRMGGGALVLLAYTGATGQLSLALSPVQWSWLAITALLLLAFVSSWYAALERAPATAVTCVLTLGAPITAALSLAAGRGLSPQQIAGHALVCLAVLAFLALPRASSPARRARTPAGA